MTAQQIRSTFFDFFSSKDHKVVDSAPIVLKDDPTLMFTNAGMNQFKDIFLGNAKPVSKRVANSQKCLRVSGKHNDLEEVGIDTFHHTMFEMLGNWSFGDYFKKEAIEWAWELLTAVYKIDQDRLYVTIFGGDKKSNLSVDDEALECWKAHIDEDRILQFDRKDNFWEMGETGPCGPCSEIHVDIRKDKDREEVNAAELVNTGHPEVLELWNLVFIQYNRLQNGTLEELPQKHIDTGMGFERLCMILQGKRSNYDSDVFQPLINFIEKEAGVTYNDKIDDDIAMRVMVDHIRAVAFCICDGQLPYRDGAGYVVRRILRRAIRYGYHAFGIKEPFMNTLVPILADQMADIFPELKSQQVLIQQVVVEEEISFMRTLEQGLKRLKEVSDKVGKSKVIDGRIVFELYDTFGFPVDLTALVAKEYDLKVDHVGFEKEMKQQKDRSRKATAIQTSDWVSVSKKEKVSFIGYEVLEVSGEILKYRQLQSKGDDVYQVVLESTPFYAESGGQVGDTGSLTFKGKEIEVIDTKKENELTVHIVKELPESTTGEVIAKVDAERRLAITNNHSATHLMHAALKEVLGDHVEQKGSLVDQDHLRFDFTHFSKMTDEELSGVEALVNQRIRDNIIVEIEESISIKKALAMGATALFGEKYGEEVRVVAFDKDFSIELCGGTHVKATGQIGAFKIVSEGAIAAGIRRIEAISGLKVEEYVNDQLQALKEIKALMKNPKSVQEGVKQLLEENSKLSKASKAYINLQVKDLKNSLKEKAEKINDVHFIGEIVEVSESAIKDLSFELGKDIDNLFLVLGTSNSGKVNLTIMISKNLVGKKKLHAGELIKEFAKEIKGGGGGQPFYATAGGGDASGLPKAISKAKEFIKKLT